eukprot:61637_1
MSNKSVKKIVKKKPKHKPYAEMVLDAILHLPKEDTTIADIELYVKTNNDGLGTGKTFTKAIARALKKGIDDKILHIKRSGKYRITALGKLSEKNKTKKKRSNKNKSKTILPKKKHYETAIGRTSCCNKQEHTISDDILYKMIDFTTDIIEEKKKHINQWNNGLQQKFNNLDVDKNGKLNKKDVILLMVEYVGYKQSVALDEIDDIMEQCDKDKDGLISFNDFLTVTPKMQRFPVYKSIREQFNTKYGCSWLLHECPLPGAFPIAVRKAFPDAK